jgi:hypothetical protein
LTEESRKLTCGESLIVNTPHQVRVILQQKVERWLTDARILKYETILMESDDLTLIAESYLNLAEFLLGRKTQDPMESCCLGIIEYQTTLYQTSERLPFWMDTNCLQMVPLK